MILMSVLSVRVMNRQSGIPDLQGHCAKITDFRGSEGA